MELPEIEAAAEATSKERSFNKFLNIFKYF
jgi:hypothetical protein